MTVSSRMRKSLPWRTGTRIFAVQAGGTLTLTDKEIVTLKCLANDMNIEETAAALCVSPAAVKTRLKSAKTWLGCNTTYQTIVKAVRAKLI